MAAAVPLPGGGWFSGGGGGGGGGSGVPDCCFELVGELRADAAAWSVPVGLGPVRVWPGGPN